MLIHLKAYADLFIISLKKKKARKTRQRKCNMTRVTQWQFCEKKFRSICVRNTCTAHGISTEKHTVRRNVSGTFRAVSLYMYVYCQKLTVY